MPFDALAYGIPPSSLAAIEPVQLLSPEVASRALADAGYATRPFDRSRASAVFGAEGGTDLAAAYTLRALAPSYFGDLPPELDQHLPALTEDSFPGVLANVIAGRIANRLDLGGVNYTVDAACASSLAALDVACKELVQEGATWSCGGADLHNGINDYLLFASVHALSPTGQCRTFDAAADGIALGEGVACVVLKRLADAERDGDRIYAVVKGVAGSSDGRSLGLTAPRRQGQQRALERAPTAGRGHARRPSAWSRPTARARSSATARSSRPSARSSRRPGPPRGLRARLGQVPDRPHQVRRRASPGSSRPPTPSTRACARRPVRSRSRIPAGSRRRAPSSSTSRPVRWGRRPRAAQWRVSAPSASGARTSTPC